MSSSVAGHQTCTCSLRVLAQALQPFRLQARAGQTKTESSMLDAPAAVPDAMFGKHCRHVSHSVLASHARCQEALSVH